MAGSEVKPVSADRARNAFARLGLVAGGWYLGVCPGRVGRRQDNVLYSYIIIFVLRAEFVDRRFSFNLRANKVDRNHDIT